MIIRSICLLALAIAGIGLLTAQLSCTHSAPTERQVYPERLRKHVSMLSEEFVPRSYKHVWNLEYHGANDTLRWLDFNRMAKVVLGVYEAVAQMENDNG